MALPKGMYGGETKSKSKWYNPGTWGDVEKTWTPDPGAFTFQQGVPDWAQAYAGNLGQMQAGGDIRAQQMQMMDLLAQRARGENLASEAMAAQQLALGQGAVASQAATAQRGGYDPAAARASMYSQGQLAGDVAGQAAIAAAQEQMAAAQAAGQMGQGMRGLDVQQMVAMQQLAQQYRQMGMLDKAMDLEARMQYEEAKKLGFTGKQKTEGGWGTPTMAVIGGGVGGYFGGAAGAQLGAQFGGTIGSGLDRM